MKITFLILVFNSWLFCSTFAQVKRNNPNLSDDVAKQIADSIDKHSKHFKVPAKVVAAIAMVESAYHVDAVNAASNDYGIMQVNQYNINAYGFSKSKLLTDIDYSVWAGVRVFKWFYKNYDSVEEAVKRYNVGTKKDADKTVIAMKYWKLVKSYM